MTARTAGPARWLVAVATAWLGACAGDAAVAIDAGDDARPLICVGDCARAVDVELRGQGQHGAVGPLADEDALAIRSAIQGGWIVLIGVRAHNVHTTGSQVSATLRDLTTNQVLSVEERPASFSESADGWATPHSSDNDLANVAVCPVGGAIDVDGQRWLAEVTLTDADGRTASGSVIVRLDCDVDEPACAAECNRP